MKNKTLQELTLKDNFLFGAVMLDEETCRQFLEIALGIEIERVKVSTEKSIVYHPEYHGVRLDAYARDEKNTCYNIEMQVEKTAIVKRSRYYHGQMDMELLLKGMDYEKLPNSYVIFICCYDPFGQGKYKYTVEQRLRENPEYNYSDGSYTIFLNTKGTNKDEVSEELVNFLEFVNAELEESQQEYNDPFVARLQEKIRQIKSSRVMEERFMILKEMLQKERREGYEEGQREGYEEGQKQLLLALIQKKIEKGKSVEQIADELEEDISAVRQVYDELVKNNLN